MSSIASALARWAHDLAPTAEDVALARRSLLDTVAVTLAARAHPVSTLAASLPEGARWAVAAHILDFDDLHMPSTTHISAVCVPTALATGGADRSYLAAAGVMARLGTALGWPHYSAGWHATCTAGAPPARPEPPSPWDSRPTRSRPLLRSRCPQPAGCSGHSAPTPSPCKSASRSTPVSGRRDFRRGRDRGSVGA